MRQAKRAGLEVSLFIGGPAVAFLTTPVIARALGPADRGQYGLALATSVVAIGIGNWGQAELLISQIREGRNTFAAARKVSLGFSVLAACGAFVFLLEATSLTLALATVVVIPVLTQANLWRSVMVARGRTTRLALTTFVGSFARLPLIFGAALIGVLKVTPAVMAVQWTMAAALWVGLGRHCRVGSALIAHPNAQTISAPMNRVSQVAGGIPYFAFDVLTAVNLNSAIFILALVSTPEDLGTFSAVYAVGAAALALSLAFKNRIQASLFSGSGGSPRHEVGVLCCLMLVGFAFAMVLADPVSSLLFGSEYEGAPNLLRLMSLLIAAQISLDMVHAVLIVMGRRRSLIAVASVGAIGSICGCIVLIPAMGANGAALGSAVGALCASLLGGTVVYRGRSTLRGLGSA